MNDRKNLINLAVFLLVALLSTLLIMAAISMLDLRGNGSPGGENNKRAYQNDGSGKNRNKQDRNNNNKNKKGSGQREDDNGSNWKERAQRRRGERRSFDRGDYAYGQGPESMIPGDGWEYDIAPDQMPNLDISGNEGLPDMSFGMGGNTFVLKEGKNSHIPAFEVLGVPNYPFVRVMAMDNYRRSHWSMINEAPELMFLFGEKVDRKFSENTVKIKPVEPSKGYIPVLSGNFEMKYEFSLLEYKQSGVFYSTGVIENFYEMKYEDPPTEAELINAKTDDDYYYDIYVPEVVERIVDEVIENCETDYEAIKFVEKFLLENYTYDNTVLNNYGSGDAVVSFLTGKDRVGNHLDFVSAYAIILRAAGIPCRLALGYKLLPGVKYQVVYADQVYIYPEIKFEDYGWVPMDVFPYDVFYRPPKETITQITFADGTTKRGETVTVRGTVTDSSGNPIDNMTVLVYLKQYKSEPCISYAKAYVTNGNFEAVFDIKGDISAGKYHIIADVLENDVYRTSSSDPELKILADTFIDLEERSDIIGNKLNFAGRIVDFFTYEGIEGLEVHVSFEGMDLVETVVSEEDGKLYKEIEIEVPEDYPYYKNFFFAGRYLLFYGIEFKGTEIYTPYFTRRGVYMWKIYWINVTVAVVLLLGVVLLCVAIVLRKKGAFRRDGGKFPVLAAEGPGMIVAADAGAESVERNHGKVYIEFPQIGEGLPDVWGIKENLAVVFHDDEGNRGEIGAVFHKKGEYRIKISGKNDEYGARNIRIVDYREEIIAIGKNFLKEMSAKISGITDFMTLREIHDIIKPNIASERHWVLEDAFMVFEKAVYSDEDIVRSDYEKFYVFARELGKNSSI